MKKRNKKEKDRFLRNQDGEGIKNRVWLGLNIFFTVIYLLWRGFFTLPLQMGAVSAVAGIALFVVELLGAAEAAVHYFNMHKIENHPLPEAPYALFPDVDIFICTYSEPVELLYKTVNACTFLDYPDKSKIHVYICDDGHRPAMRALAEQKGVHYLTRPDNKDAKAGNLNYAMAHSTSPLIVTLDADMIVRHEFLMHTVPYFIDNDLKNKERAEKDQIKMGFVQTPQSFYNPDLFQFNLFSESRIPNEQDYFYKDIQVARNKSNSVIYGGSNTMITRASLEAIGGFFTGAITEDFATGIELQMADFVCIGVNEVLASGLSATSLPDLIQQRTRWARGVIATARKLHLVTTRKLTFAQKANYLASTWYWYAPFKRLIYFMSPILFATFGYMVIRCTLLEVLIFWLPMYVSSNVSLKMMSRNIRTIKWTSIYETILFPFMLIPVLLESVGISLKKFKVTSKDGNNRTNHPIAYAAPFIVLIILSIVGIVNCFIMMLQSGTIDTVVVLFWLLVNVFSLFMAMFFVLGRAWHRKTERVQAALSCELADSVIRVPCLTRDFSEDGLSAMLDEPVDLDDTVTVSIKNERYSVKMKAEVRHVDKVGKKYKYAYRITDRMDSFDQWLQLLYDREPTMPTTLDGGNSSFDDLRINITKRLQGDSYENRQQPRIVMDCVLKDTTGRDVHVINFNYRYIAVQEEGETHMDGFELPIGGGLTLQCLYTRSICPGRNLYKVHNYETAHGSVRNRALLYLWIRAHTGGTIEPEKKPKGGKKPYAPKEMDFT
ncbi:MAG: glycosyltransferase [Eubacteriales bacterium]|nr:glycosyltransferase [Eubacteriales bacterium]